MNNRGAAARLRALVHTHANNESETRSPIYNVVTFDLKIKAWESCQWQSHWGCLVVVVFVNVVGGVVVVVVVVVIVVAVVLRFV